MSQFDPIDEALNVESQIVPEHKEKDLTNVSDDLTIPQKGGNEYCQQVRRRKWNPL